MSSELSSMGPANYALEVLLGGDPQAISAAGLVGVDADSRFSLDALRRLEAAGLKSPGRPMTVTELARAILSGAIPPDTQIVRRR